MTRPVPADDLAPGLVDLLRALADEHGARGVHDALQILRGGCPHVPEPKPEAEPEPEGQPRPFGPDGWITRHFAGRDDYPAARLARARLTLRERTVHALAIEDYVHAALEQHDAARALVDADGFASPRRFVSAEGEMAEVRPGVTAPPPAPPDDDDGYPPPVRVVGAQVNYRRDDTGRLVPLGRALRDRLREVDEEHPENAGLNNVWVAAGIVRALLSDPVGAAHPPWVDRIIDAWAEGRPLDFGGVEVPEWVREALHTALGSRPGPVGPGTLTEPAPVGYDLLGDDYTAVVRCRRVIPGTTGRSILPPAPCSWTAEVDVAEAAGLMSNATGNTRAIDTAEVHASLIALWRQHDRNPASHTPTPEDP